MQEVQSVLSPEVADLVGLGVLLGLVLLPVGWVVWQLWRSPLSPVRTLLYALNYLVARLLWRLEIEGHFPIPPGQGAVIVSNHRCPLDPSFIAVLNLRVVYWMVAREYCEYPPFHKLLELCGAIPVNRWGRDPAATKAAIRLAAEGELVGVFPEGRINTTERLLLPGHPGAALIALKARVPIVPCHIQGAPYDGTTLGCLLMPAHVKLKIGRLIDIAPYLGIADEREALQKLTRRLLTEIALLAGATNYQPELIGRFHNAAADDKAGNA